MAFVVVGRHHQQSVRTGPLGVPAEDHGVFRGVGPGPGDYRHPARHVLHAKLDGAHPLPVRHGGRLASGTAYHHGVRPVLELEVQQPFQSGQVHTSLGKGRNNGNGGACKDWKLHNNSSFDSAG